jgi:hypothetical protein
MNAGAGAAGKAGGFGIEEQQVGGHRSRRSKRHQAARAMDLERPPLFLQPQPAAISRPGMCGPHWRLPQRRYRSNPK